MGDWRLAVDIGGTFTDIVALAGCGKTLSIDPLQGVNRFQAVIPNEVRSLLKLETPCFC